MEPTADLGLGRQAEADQVESQSTETSTPQTDQNIPKVRVDQMVGKERDARRTAETSLQQAQLESARLQGELDASRRQPPPQQQAPPKVFSRAELRTHVDNGQISQEQMDVQLDLQQSLDADRRVEEAETRVLEKVRSEQGSQTVTAELDSWREKIPGLGNNQSEEFARANRVYQKLLSRGQPKTQATQLTAVEIAFGTLEKIPARTAEALDSHAEVSGGGADDGEDATDTSGAPNLPGLTPFMKKRYERDFENGQYSGWKDKRVVKQLTYLR